MWLFYIPIVTWIVVLTIRYRGLTFLSVNPGLPMSGLFGEQKALALAPLKSLPELARFELIPQLPIADRIRYITSLMKEQSFADAGQRGSQVAVIRSTEQLADYLESSTDPLLLQEYVDGQEFGVFYMRKADQVQGTIYSITHKTFPVVVGDGKSTLERLLMRNSRTHYMAEFLLTLHANRLAWVPANGEPFKVVEIGSHCRGSVFLDANHLITPALEAAVDRVSQRISGFCFGRYDIRVPSEDDLQSGCNLKVLEVNGVTSESTNMYDPEHSLLKAYQIIFKQWQLAFEIGQSNIRTGIAKVSLLELAQYVFKQREGEPTARNS